MLKFPEEVRVYVAMGPADMRKHADGLSALVLGSLNQEPTSGHLFVFFNRRRDIVRILFWDRDGYWVVSKRLERGRFRRFKVEGETPSVVVRADEFAQLLRGVEIRMRKGKPTFH